MWNTWKNTGLDASNLADDNANKISNYLSCQQYQLLHKFFRNQRMNLESIHTEEHYDRSTSNGFG